jgi:hypothetical protein
MESIQQCVLAVVLLDVLVDPRALLVRGQLWCPRHGQSLARARRLAVVDWRYWAEHRRVGRQRTRRAQPVSAVHRGEGRPEGIVAGHGALHQGWQLVWMRAEGTRTCKGRVCVWRRLALRLRHHRVSPRHLRQHVLARGGVWHDRFHHRRAGGRDDGLIVVGHHLGLLARHGPVVEVGHQHRRRLHVGVDHALVLVHVLHGAGVDGRGSFRRAGVDGGLVARAALLLAGQGRAAIFGVDGAVVA